jgi:hypothetical protein
MRRLSLASAAALALVFLPVAGCGGGGETGTGGGTSSSSASGTGGEGGDPMDFYAPPPDSCAYDCPHTTPCVEQTAHYACPSLGPFADIPHAPECGGWDGKYPAPAAGKCTASAPSKEALKRSGIDPDDKAAHVLPDGRRVHPAGKEWILADLAGGLTSGAIDVPGTPFVLAVETGFGDHAVRVIDTLNSGLALGPGGRVLASSNDGVLHALTLDRGRQGRRGRRRGRGRRADEAHHPRSEDVCRRHLITRRGDHLRRVPTVATASVIDAPARRCDVGSPCPDTLLPG